MQWIDLKYIGGLAPRLSMFAKKDDNVWNMRCPICGDSRKSKTKARGYILGKGGKYVYTCHNCGVSMSFSRFLETVDPTAYEEYKREVFLDKFGGTERIVEPAPDISRFITPKFIKYTALADLRKISQLELHHPARKYVVSRQIPSPFHSRLFYAPKFKTWTNKLKPNKFDPEKIGKDEPRLIIPFVDQGGNLFGYQGRSFFDVEPRYITIILDEEKPRVYGLDRVKMNEHVYIVEGPIDSMFLNNCLAMGGAHLDKTTQQIGLRPHNTTIVYDNEPRNKDIVAAIEKAINLEYNVCIWPESMAHKDINDMVRGGMSTEQIHGVVAQHTYRDLLAKMRLTQWKKCET
jgi:transcription elongation factor Elf1